MTPAEKQTARDRIAALRVRWIRAVDDLGAMDDKAYYARCDHISALESLCDELTRPEPEDLTRDLERSIRQAEVGRVLGVQRMLHTTPKRSAKRSKGSW